MKNYMQANRFLQKYGPDAFKIIAAYEEAADIPPNERYANWYGDYGIFEPSLNEEMTYDKLLSRYKAGLKYLGIIHEQAKSVCSRFLSEQLAEHIREQLGRHNADAEYRPTSIITKMDTPEFTRDSLRLCPCEMPQMQAGGTAEPCLFQKNKEKRIGYKPVYHREN